MASPASPIKQSQPRRGLLAWPEHILNLLMDHWALIITLVFGLLVLAAFLVPILAFLGLNNLSKPLFYSMHLVCGQIPSHSFYLFGHQLGLCQRNFSIYTSMFLGSLIFVLTKKRIPGLPWWLWVLMCVPMALDGFTQMFGWRESNMFLRLLTGSLFGLGCVWFALPLMHKNLMETEPVPTAPQQPQVPQPAARP
ncbi:putative membrane protein [Thermosporothrix hazakensis]|jgi:uncharacterized membrane protein|uniref:Putative membrane protein n=1 Tax=Thermosporothrix hazakensis TaxID=644383 RepID=A0A326TYE4_THEHA|nr:DUF2085 domain-containing protein [Thermosporothrix hazakensis]PZW22415.1 putative membrane protein [Thermosporothrix hazakensis]GCE49169.1 hypothetical protein KTH_40380 [Thermosporothrix hazakensis]